MNYRRSFAAVGLASALALAACGAEEQVAEPASRPAVASKNAADAFQYYYDVTHPAPAAPKANSAFDHYYDVTHPAPKTKVFSGDAKDHPRYNPGATAEWPGDAKDHPRYAHTAPSAIPVSNGDAKDHPGYGQIEPAGSPVLGLQAPVRPHPALSFQAELASLAASEGLTGLSPAFLQPVQVCSGLSPASASGCTTDQLEAALPGNPR